MMYKAVFFCMASVALTQEGAKKTSINLMDEGDPNAPVAPRKTLTTADELWEFATHGDGNNGVFGCFAVDEQGGVVGRNNSDSHYGVFRDASVKNKDVPFGIVKDLDLIRQIGVDERRLPALITMHLDKERNYMEFRKSQFFEDHTIYFSEDPTRIFAYFKKDSEGKYTLKDMRPKGPNPNAPPAEPSV